MLQEAIGPQVNSTRLPSRTFGDVCVEWDADKHEEMIPEIQALMDQGIAFLVLEKPKGKRKEEAVEVTDLARQAASRRVFARDPHLVTIAQSPIARIGTVSGVSEIKPLRRAKDARDAAQNDTVGVRQGKGG